MPFMHFSTFSGFKNERQIDIPYALYAVLSVYRSRYMNDYVDTQWPLLKDIY